jgi:hypothetical protein
MRTIVIPFAGEAGDSRLHASKRARRRSSLASKPAYGTSP